jgi:predicted TIM-barrel fold metal-dependent hydrolase
MDRLVSLLLLVTLMLLSWSSTVLAVAAADREQPDEWLGAVAPTSRDELLAQRGRRRTAFAGRVEDLRAQLHNTPSDEALHRKLQAYEKKLESLNAPMDARRVDRMMAREEMLQEVHGARKLRQAS